MKQSRFDILKLESALALKFVCYPKCSCVVQVIIKRHGSVVTSSSAVSSGADLAAKRAIAALVVHVVAVVSAVYWRIHHRFPHGSCIGWCEPTVWGRVPKPKKISKSDVLVSKSKRFF